MTRRIVLLGSVIFLAAGAVYAQETALQIPGLRERAVVLDIVSRIVESNQEEVWNSSNTRITIPGRPVNLKLVGENIVVAVQFTPYLNNNGQYVLVAQGQIWMDVPNVGIRYQTTMQTIPLEYGEQVYFFPLGQANSENAARIEIQLVVYPYTGGSPGTGVPEDAGEAEAPR
ncbi:MAG: hypothetical protein LBO80_07830 [Treponema sp.]|jgi:hypothetical protein|nr:hypothetical protein [Treponema sp.]